MENKDFVFDDNSLSDSQREELEIDQNSLSADSQREELEIDQKLEDFENDDEAEQLAVSYDYDHELFGYVQPIQGMFLRKIC
jgi:hypothetical protein